jgi:hypothetical protein
MTMEAEERERVRASEREPYAVDFEDGERDH